MTEEQIERLKQIRERVRRLEQSADDPHVKDWGGAYYGDVYFLLSLHDSQGEHRCPHFQPKGEDSGGAYNAGIIQEVTNDLLDSWARERLHAKPTSWYTLLIKQLIQRIANLRVMLTVSNNTATSMRSRCVEKVKELRDRFQQAAEASSLPNDLTASRDAAVANALTRLLGELESLSLEQGEQEKR